MSYDHWHSGGKTYARLPGNTRGDDDNLCASKGLLEAIIGGQVTDHLGGGRDVRQIGSNTGSVDDIEEAQLQSACVSMLCTK